MTSPARLWPALLLGGWILFLLVFVAAPLGALFLKCFEDRDDAWVGLANFADFLHSSRLVAAAGHSAAVALIATALTLALAFPFAFGLTRTAMPGKVVLRALAQLPLLAPSLLPALSLVALFGNKGLAHGALMGASIYGPIGIVIASVFAQFPQAVMILANALAVSDARLHEAARALGAGKLRRFFTVTLPGAQYGLVSAALVLFTGTVADFGIPIVLGGHYQVLATEVFEQVIGLQDFPMGAIAGLALLLPVAFGIAVERWSAGRQKAQLTARATLAQPQPNLKVDLPFLLLCGLIALPMVVIVVMGGLFSLIAQWPYKMVLTLRHFDFAQYDSSGWDSYGHSLQLAFLTAILGTALVFGGAFLSEKLPGHDGLKRALRVLAMLPLGVPGMVLGLAYIFFFNHPANPLGGLYATMGILVLCSCAHFYSVGHLTAVTALKQLDNEFEAVSASLKIPLWRTFWRVTVPLCLPTILDIALYLFVSGMITVSAVVFLYTPDTKPASVAVLNMDESGTAAAAAALCMVIFASSAAARMLHAGVARIVLRRTQRWRYACAD